MSMMKKILALLLALSMVFALAACGGNAGPAEKEEETVSQRHASRGEEAPAEKAEETPEPTPEPEPEPTPEPTPSPEELLIGSWVAKWDLTEMLLKELEGELGEIDRNFGDYMEEPFSLPIRLEFRGDGSYRMFITDSDLEGIVDPFQKAMRGFLIDVLYDQLVPALSETGMDLSGVSSMADLEKKLNMSLDDIMNASVGMDLDSFVESSFNVDMLREMTEAMNMEGSYAFDGSVLKFDTNEEMTVSFQDEDSFLLDGDDGGVGMFPLKFTREA